MFSDLLQQLLLALLPNEPVYYIGGSEVLPPPLSREEETAALTALCAGDKSAAQRTEVSFDEPLNTDWDGNELLLSDVLGTDEDEVSRPMEDDAERRALHEAVAKLSERDRDIISLRFGLLGRREYTQKEVADRMGISQSYISRLEKRILLRLRREMQKIMA